MRPSHRRTVGLVNLFAACVLLLWPDGSAAGDEVGATSLMTPDGDGWAARTTSPAAPLPELELTLEGSWAGFSQQAARAVAVANGYAYVADWVDGLHVFDVSNPIEPRRVGGVRTPGWASDVVISARYAYVVDGAVNGMSGNLHVFDVSTPADPQRIGGCTMSERAHRLVLSGQQAFVATDTWMLGGGLVVIDLSNPAQPRTMAKYATAPGAAAGVAEWGTLDFRSRLDGVVDARVSIRPPWALEWYPADGRFLAQLNARLPGESWQAVGVPVPFPDTPDTAKGFITAGGSVAVPGVLPGSPVEVMMTVWAWALGSSYEQALARGLGFWGASSEITVLAGGATPAPLVGLQAFEISVPMGGIGNRLPLHPNPPPVRWSENGHVYERVEAPGMTWSAARAAAEARTYEGIAGRLVTITSEAESAFLYAQLAFDWEGHNAPLARYWIGAIQAAGSPEPAEGWQWITGEPFTDARWAPDEPNNAGPGEDVAWLTDRVSAGGRQWGDAAPTNELSNGYVVEFERTISEPFRVVVPGTADLWLAGAPAGTRASGTDSAPSQSPVEAAGVKPGAYYIFEVGGGVGHGPGQPLATPDGYPNQFATHLGFEFAHRGRDGPETLTVIVTDLGPDAAWSGGDDTTLFRKDYTTDRNGWAFYTSEKEPPILALGNTVRVAFESPIEGSIGNLLDAVDFGPGVGGALPTNAPPAIFTQPDDLELALGETAILRVVASGGTPLGYLWNRVEGPVPSSDLTMPTLELTNVQPTDAGHYSVVITNLYGIVTSRVATVTVASTLRPRLVSASTRSDPSRVTVVFSQAMDPASATRVENYRISDGSPVRGAELVAPDTVVLQTAISRPGWHELTVNQVRPGDPGGLPVPANSTVPFALTDGRVNWTLHDRVPPDATLDALLEDPRFDPRWASRRGLFTSFEFPSDDHGALVFGQLRAFLHPPVTGHYRFWFWGDDSGAVFLSQGDDPAHKREIARLDGRADYRSYPVASDLVELKAGSRYYLEAVFLETDDRDGLGVAWQLPGEPPPAPGDPPIAGEFLSSLSLPGAPSLNRTDTRLEGVVGQPLEIRLNESDLGGSPPLALQWWLSREIMLPQPDPTGTGTIDMPFFVSDPIEGATNLTLTLPWVEPPWPGAAAYAFLSLHVTNAYGSLGDVPPGGPGTGVTIAMLSVRPDPLPPAVESGEANDRGDGILVRFSEAVALASATNVHNYSLTGGPTLLSATRQPDGRTVLLATSAQARDANLELAVRDVADLEGNRMPAEERVSFPTFVEQTGVLARELWRANRIGQYLETLLDLPAFQADQPISRRVWPGAETPADTLDHYGQRLWGWIVPPVTGEYRLANAADETAGLYLGRDDRREDLERVAYVERRTAPREWTRYPTQISEPRTLEAGNAYAFEVLMSEGIGSDHLSLGWVRPGGSAPELIDASALRLRLDPRGLQPTIFKQPAPLVAWQQVGGAFRARAVAGAFALGALTYQWQRNGADIPGATSDEYALPVPLDLVADSGARYCCAITDASGSRVVSGEAALTVLPQEEAVRLTVAHEGGKIVVRWPDAPGVRLQRATRLHRPDWQDVPGARGVFETVPVPGVGANLFRLVRGPSG